MLFHVTHVHSPETCPAHDPQRVRSTLGKVLGSAEEIGVKLIGVYAEAPGHRMYFIVETDTVEKLEDLFFPALSIGHAEIRPVTDAVALLKRKFGE
jgi:hypothetical protein